MAAAPDSQPCTSVAWDDRWEECLPLLSRHLSASSMVSLSLSSRSIMSRLNSTPGWWQDACHSCLSWPPSSPSTSNSNPTSLAAAAATNATTSNTNANHHTVGLLGGAVDQQARQVLFAAVALAYAVKQAKSPPPQTVQIPPWLPGQPGYSRGFKLVDSATLDPPLVLDSTQLSWLAYGSLAGHTSGVFISTCSSSPRSHQPCAYLAAVVYNKSLVAELYIPRSSTLPDPWAGILSPTVLAHSCCCLQCGPNCDRHCCSNDSRRNWHRPSSSTPTVSSSSSSSRSRQCPGLCKAAARCSDGDSTSAGLELWLSDSVQLHTPQLEHQRPEATAAAAAAGAGGRGGRGGRARRGRTAAAGSSNHSGVTWSDVHKLIMECIADNASRVKAARGSTVIPPGTPAAATIEQQLAGLTAAGGPVLDLRRLQWDTAAAAAGQQQAAAVRRQQHKEGRVASAAKAAAVAAGGWGWQATASEALQSALAAAMQDGAQQLGEGMEGLIGGSVMQAADAAFGVDSSEASRGEILAVLVERLGDLVPDVQVLVLPVLLPAGRAAQRVPSTGGSRLSAPKLLCLNVPFLVALRKYAWEQLPNLRHILLMCGDPLPIPAAQPVTQQQQQQQLQQQQLGHHSMQQQCENMQQQGGQVLSGVFCLEDLEQQWQKQLHLEQSSGYMHQQHQQQQQQQQQIWQARQEEEWFEQQVAEQGPPHKGPKVYSMYSMYQDSIGSLGVRDDRFGDAAGQSSSTAYAVQNGTVEAVAGQKLSRAATDALHDMVHSCMDRSVSGQG